MVPLDSQRPGRSKIREVVKKKKDVWTKTTQMNTSDLGPENETICAPCAHMLTNRHRCGSGL